MSNYGLPVIRCEVFEKKIPNNIFLKFCSPKLSKCKRFNRKTPNTSTTVEEISSIFKISWYYSHFSQRWGGFVECSSAVCLQVHRIGLPDMSGT